MPNETRNPNETFIILTVREVAEYLRLSQAKVYRLAKQGNLPVFRIGKSWRFRKDLLDEWLVKQSTMKVAQD
ncbi:MAG: helix-turn-helix domain-containing protein [Chloroflexi bacterium]|nr:helix-turn-helix domain-containing protein [Chloroflexota bacterium]